MIRERLVESLIRSALKEQQVVLVDGIEGCGKTFTCNRFARSSYNLQSEDGWEAKLARIDPAYALRGKSPRLLDEWQEAPSLMRYILGSNLLILSSSIIRDLFLSTPKRPSIWRPENELCVKQCFRCLLLKNRCNSTTYDVSASTLFWS